MTLQDFQKRYQFNQKTDKIGGGSFGIVYKAYDTVLDREVAIKISEVKHIGDKEFSLLEEYKAVEALSDHPNIANYEKVYRFESFPATYDYAIMQYYSLGNLSHYLKHNDVSLQDREKLVLGILEGIAFLHLHKVVHRDLKPSNILVVDRRGQLIPKITDFGLSKQAGTDAKGSRFTNSFAGGTLQYSSPEQIKGLPLRLNTDLWSFGAIAYEILTGNTLFETQSESTATAEWQKEITEMILHTDVTHKFKTLAPNWQNAIAACLQRDITQRVQSAEVLLGIINNTSRYKAPEKEKPQPNNDETIIDSNKGTDKGKTPTPPEGETQPIPPKPKKNKWLIPMVAVFGVVLLVIGYFIVKPDSITEPEQPNLQLYEEDGLYGYKLGDSIVIPASFEKANAFVDDKAQVTTADSTFYINKEGNWVDKYTAVLDDVDLKEEQADKNAFNEARKSNTINAYQSYIAQHPNGKYKGQAQVAINNIEKAEKQRIAEQDEKDKSANINDVTQELIPKNELESWIKKGNNLAITKKAASSGNAPAQRRMGRINANIYKNDSEAVDWYRKAANQGDKYAQNNLGTMYETGRGVNQNSSKAVSWYRKAANQDNAIAQINLGFMYANGKGVTKNENEAVKWYQKAANQGYAIAQNNLGRKYENGKGVTKNETEAVKWYLKAAKQGNASSQNNLGVMYGNGRGVTKNETEAVKWYLKAANQGYATAQNNLGIMFENGRGVTKDDSEAVKWFLKAANQGNASSQNNLGFMFENGRGVNKDETEAVKWYRKAANQGNSTAQKNLGIMYANGKGVTKNYPEAIKWYRKACDNGVKSACAKL